MDSDEFVAPREKPEKRYQEEKVSGKNGTAEASVSLTGTGLGHPLRPCRRRGGTPLSPPPCDDGHPLRVNN